jgi:glycosyltransferase involved in cell wall biosynthesis
MLLFVWQFDPRGNKVGGIGKYVLSFLKHIITSKRIGIIGVTTSVEEVGKWQVINIEGKEIDFLPICYVKDENIKTIIPLFLKFCIGLLIYKKAIPINAVIFHQRLEYVLSTLNLSNKQYCMIHFDLFEYLDKENGESYWRVSPFIFNKLTSFILNHIDGVFSVNSQSIRYIEDNHKSYCGQVNFAPTWADNSIFTYEHSIGEIRINQIRKKYKLPQNKKIILVVGRLNKQKNIELTIDLLQKLDNVLIIIIGTGPSKKLLEKKSQSLIREKKIIFLGRLSQGSIRDLFYLSNLYLSTSMTEGMSVALLESLNMGVPVVTTPTGESKKIIIRGCNGYVTSGWELTEILPYIRDVLDNPDKFQKDNVIGSSCHWTPEKTIPRLLNIMGLSQE